MTKASLWFSPPTCQITHTSLFVSIIKTWGMSSLTRSQTCRLLRCRECSNRTLRTKTSTDRQLNNRWSRIKINSWTRYTLANSNPLVCNPKITTHTHIQSPSAVRTTVPPWTLAVWRCHHRNTWAWVTSSMSKVTYAIALVITQILAIMKGPKVSPTTAISLTTSRCHSRICTWINRDKIWTLWMSIWLSKNNQWWPITTCKTSRICRTFSNRGWWLTRIWASTIKATIRWCTKDSLTMTTKWHSSSINTLEVKILGTMTKGKCRQDKNNSTFRHSKFRLSKWWVKAKVRICSPCILARINSSTWISKDKWWGAIHLTKMLIELKILAMKRQTISIRAKVHLNLNSNISIMMSKSVNLIPQWQFTQECHRQLDHLKYPKTKENKICSRCSLVIRLIRSFRQRSLVHLHLLIWPARHQWLMMMFPTTLISIWGSKVLALLASNVRDLTKVLLQIISWTTHIWVQRCMVSRTTGTILRTQWWVEQIMTTLFS